MKSAPETKRSSDFPLIYLTLTRAISGPDSDEAVKIGHVEVTGQSHWEPARRELWRILLLAALGVLLLEWYIYNRRVYV